MSTAPGVPDPYRPARPSGDFHRSTDDNPNPHVHPAAGPPARGGTPAHTAGPVTTGLTGVGAAAVATALPWSFPPSGGPTAFDLEVGARVDPRLDPRPWLAEVLALATATGVVLALLAGSAVWFAWQRRWWEAATVVLVPEIAVAINAWLLKPWWGRPLHDYLAYPSGHTVHLVSMVTTLVLLLQSVRARVVIVVLAAAGWCAGAVGMIALDYHLATDVIGGAAAGIALAIALYWAAVAIRRTFPAHPSGG
ncbi:phosphatase PAP2 family protein [Nocardia sp. CA-290969]|uniref:phosphatase PAP2 family protein n=1 Tax=Nocardia sp. CA-290969 TaxID=3239986 RepID=UPI003D8CBE26